MIKNTERHGISYRKDIDGLRAIAVFAVILFHAKISLFSSGFLGVDVFFVISGYLITTIIINDINNSEFSFVKFYSKRIIRIFPALILTLFLVLFFGRLFLFPDEFKNLSKQVIAGSSFFSNILLYIEVGYFDQAAELKPLLHLWSLAVEEQFYIVIPYLLFTIYKYKKRLIPITLILLSLLSFAYFASIIIEKPGLAFYSPLSRFWEIIAGSCVSYFSGFYKKNNTVKNVIQNHHFSKELWFLVLIVLLFISISIGAPWVFKSPYLTNLIPVAIVSTIIYQGENFRLNRILLQNNLIVTIGKMSYPIYLIHWPFFVFCRYAIQNEPNSIVYLFATLITFIMSYLAYKFIETPIRYNLKLTSLKKVAILTCFIFFIISYSIQIYLTNGITTERGANFVKTFSTLGFENEDFCHKKFNIGKDYYCGLSNIEKEPSVMIIGDSHARHYFDSLSSFYSKRNIGLLGLGRGGCPPFLNIDRNLPMEGRINCHLIYEKALDLIENSHQIKVVILAASFSSYFTNGLLYKNNEVKFDNFAEVNKNAFENIIIRLEKANKKIIVLKQIPILLTNPRLCFERNLKLFKIQKIKCESSRKSVENYFANYEPIFKYLQSHHKNIYFYDPMDIFCDKEVCYGKNNNEVLYFDETHINQFGSDFIKKNFESNSNQFN